MKVLSSYEAMETPLPVALVGAFVAAGRVVMPATKGGEPRTEEVRDTLTRIMANAEFYLAYRRDMEAAFRAFGVALPLDRSAVPHAEYDDADIAANGFVNVGESDRLAALALDPSAYEGINQLLFEEIPAGRAEPKTVGSWLAQAQVRWPVGPYKPPQWLLEKAAAADLNPSVADSNPSLQGASPSATPGTLKTLGQKWFWLIIAGLSGFTCLIGVVGFGTYRVGEQVHRSLDQLEADTAEGKFTTAVGHLRKAQDSAVNSAWPVPASAKARLAATNKSPRLLEQVIRSNNLPESEAALREAVSMPLLDRDPSYRYALGLTLRRGGKLTEASGEFEVVLARLGEKSHTAGPGAGTDKDSSTEPPPQLTSLVVGDVRMGGKEVRLVQAMTLLELGDVRRAKEWLGPAVGATDDRPFSSQHVLWLCDRVEITEPALKALVADQGKAATPIELYEHAISCLYHGHFTRSATFFDRLFAHPDYATLPGDEENKHVHLYYASAAAVRAGRFKDKDSPTEDAAKQWHRKAFTWAEEGKGKWQTARVTPTCYWFSIVRHDSWLAVTRDHPLIGQLTSLEQQQWQHLWEELDLRFDGLRPMKWEDDPGFTPP